MKMELEETLRHLKGAPIRVPNRYRNREPGWDTKPGTALLCRLLFMSVAIGNQGWEAGSTLAHACQTTPQFARFMAVR